LTLLALLAITHLLLHRVDAAHEVTRAVEVVRHAVVLVPLTDGIRRFAQLLAQLFDFVADAALEIGIGLTVLAHQAARVVDLFLEPVVPDPFRGFLQFAGRLAVGAPHFARHAVDLFLQFVDLRLEVVLPLADLPRALAAASASVRLRHRHRFL
jgi:hypothetical protein